jgi:hypothetical protein
MAEAGVSSDPSSRLPYLFQPALDACHAVAYGAHSAWVQSDLDKLSPNKKPPPSELGRGLYNA